ncbi:hypothetical protein EDE08_109321 [Bradyrhizobium sp. R2.2-H]|jgi:hypothetical protein|uniref:hypothetical protein n=1 Tax=unclassified Bradyrhizobium TaxID=2631580 RepID=UPI00104C73AB|nr:MULTISPECIES: hypothetical protein [unclassified Bradyrhizobium]TCU68280.1 hypothetical protein EDE10_10992 [Bradyrhizobium sp. Y-H1]TCU70098.1 hypothetical protein EDE08_109321 [Bradyrhizobium sp. R2.2-H]
MNMISKLFAPKTSITSATIRAEIERAEVEINSRRGQLDRVLAGIALMTDSQHGQAEADAAAIKRAILRLEARANHLAAELPNVVAAEEAAAKVAADDALRQRAEAARKANTKEAAKLLADYAVNATRLSEVIAKLNALDVETAAVNAALRSNPVAESVLGYDAIHRRSADRPAGERRTVRKCWVYRYPGSPRDTDKVKFQYESPHEVVRQADIGPDGEAIPVPAVQHDYYNRVLTIIPTLEDREVVVERVSFRPGQTEAPLSSVRLPPAFSGEPSIWPRR